MKKCYTLSVFIGCIFFHLNVLNGQIDSLLNKDRDEFNFHIENAYNSIEGLSSENVDSYKRLILERLKKNVPTLNESIKKVVYISKKKDVQESLNLPDKGYSNLQKGIVHKSTLAFIDTLLSSKYLNEFLWMEIQLIKSGLLNAHKVNELEAEKAYLLSLNKLNEFNENIENELQKTRIALANIYYKKENLENAEKYYTDAYMFSWIHIKGKRKDFFRKIYVRAVRGLIKVMEDKKELAKLERLFIIPMVKQELESYKLEAIKRIKKAN